MSKSPRTIFSKYWDLFIANFCWVQFFLVVVVAGRREHVRMVEPSQSCKLELMLHSLVAYITLDSKIVITVKRGGTIY